MAHRRGRADTDAKALIRAAAMVAFAEHGYAGASIRQVAAAADVSPGLIQHHFPTKELLRAAVDDFVLEQAAGIVASIQAIKVSDPASFSRTLNKALAAIASADPALMAYLRRTLLEAGPSAHRIFDGLMTITRNAVEELIASGVVASGLDPVWTSLQVLMLNLGPLLLQPLIDAHLAQPLLSDAGASQWQQANAELALGGMLAAPPPGTRHPPTPPI
jgi:AcrR family transcriptional regulator